MLDDFLQITANKCLQCKCKSSFNSVKSDLFQRITSSVDSFQQPHHYMVNCPFTH